MDQEMKQYLSAMEDRIDAKLSAMKDQLIETMRNMQTELLRGMAAHLASSTIRFRKVEADQSNLDAAVSGRMEILERRLGEIEQRLGMVHP